MENFISSGSYQQLNKAPDSAARDHKRTAEKADAPSAPSKLSGAVQVAAKKPSDEKSVPSSSPLDRLKAWIQKPSKKELEARALATQITRMSEPFRAFVREACPALSEQNIAEALNIIAQIEPLPEDATDAQVAALVNEFLPSREEWSRDGRTTAARADHLMRVIRECRAVYLANELYRQFGIGTSGETTARALWSQVRD